MVTTTKGKVKLYIKISVRSYTKALDSVVVMANPFQNLLVPDDIGVSHGVGDGPRPPPRCLKGPVENPND